MITIKTKEEIKILAEGGKILADVLNKVAEMAKAGVSTQELNDVAEKLIRKAGGVPAFLNYSPRGEKGPYPATLCVSINDEVVHGLPSGDEILKEGDIVGLDLGLEYKKLFTDMAVSVGIGKLSPRREELLKATEKSLWKGIDVLREGATLGDYGFAVENVAEENGFGVIENLVGHGVGYSPHEDPDIPNYGKKGEGKKLKAGMVLALEPMFCEGEPEVYLADDNWTWKTKDGLYAAHFEHTVAITEKGCAILTKID